MFKVMQFVYVNLCAFIVRVGKKFCEYYLGANHLKNLVQLSGNLLKNPKNLTKTPKSPKSPKSQRKSQKSQKSLQKSQQIPRNPKNVNKNLKNLENPTETTNLWKSRTTFLR